MPAYPKSYRKRKSYTRSTYAVKPKYRKRYGGGRKYMLPGVKYGTRGIRESKYVDTNQTSFTVLTAASGGSAYILNPTIQGSGVNNRQGMKIAMQSLSIRLKFNPLLAQTTTDSIRVSIVYDKQTNTAAPVFGDIYQNLNVAAATQTNANSYPNGYNRDRFVILKDSVFHLAANSVAGAVGTGGATPFVWNNNYECFMFHHVIPLKGMETMYSANNGDITDVRTGSLLLIVGSNNSGANLQAIFQARLRFEEY